MMTEEPWALGEQSQDLVLGELWLRVNPISLFLLLCYLEEQDMINPHHGDMRARRCRKHNGVHFGGSR